MLVEAATASGALWVMRYWSVALLQYRFVLYCVTTHNDIHHVSLDKNMNSLSFLSYAPLQLSCYVFGSSVSTYKLAILIHYVASFPKYHHQAELSVLFFIINNQHSNQLLRG